MADRHPGIIAATALVILAISYFVIGQLTYPWRGVAAGVILALCGGALIWFAKTRTHALARALFGVAATAIAAPAAGLAAAQNDFLYGFLEDGDFVDARFDAYEQALAVGLPMLGIGFTVSLVLFFIGWRLHRTPAT